MNTELTILEALGVRVVEVDDLPAESLLLHKWGLALIDADLSGRSRGLVLDRLIQASIGREVSR